MYTTLPRTTTQTTLTTHILICNTSGVAFYTSNCKEVVSPERKLILYDLKKKEFFDDFSGAENCSQSVRQLLNIPSREIVEVGFVFYYIIMFLMDGYWILDIGYVMWILVELRHIF